LKLIEITSQVVGGKLKRNRKLLTDAVASFEGKTITITLKQKRTQRSSSQNAYYFGVIIPIWQNLLHDEWGEFYSIKETHEFLKYNCNYREKINTETGEILRVSKSTTENTTTDQEEFHEQCRRLAKEMFNTDIPLPNKQINLL